MRSIESAKLRSYLSSCRGSHIRTEAKGRALDDVEQKRAAEKARFAAQPEDAQPNANVDPPRC
jgi:phage terminase Nu1 subunit (DNA packaging protein)